MSATAEDMVNSPNPDFVRPGRRESEAERMAADLAWCKANGTPELFYVLYPRTRPPELMTEPEHPALSYIAERMAEIEELDTERRTARSMGMGR